MERTEISLFGSEVGSDLASYQSAISVKNSSSAAVEQTTNGPDLTPEEQAVLDFIEAQDITLFNTFISEVEDGEPSTQTMAAIDAILDDAQMNTLQSMGDDGEGGDQNQGGQKEKAAAE